MKFMQMTESSEISMTRAVDEDIFFFFFINIFVDYIQYKIPQDALHNRIYMSICGILAS